MLRCLFIASLLVSAHFAAGYRIVEDIATTAGGYDIPIKIYLPDQPMGLAPVHFYIHGGGWNGGDEHQVPPATISRDANFLCDRLGIIYVGLAYRCKGNDGTFQLAIEDLEASVAWFMARAEAYGADLTRIGFGGSSAGSTLSSVMAQRYSNCRLYIGNEGMYNILDHDEALSAFPNAEAKEIYGLSTESQQRAASAYHNLRNPPPATLLLQGTEDQLCHPSQSQKFAAKIKEEGGEARLVLYEGINHTCLNIHYPEVFENSVKEIARLFQRAWALESVDFTALVAELQQAMAPMYPEEDIPSQVLVGTWKGRFGKLDLQADGVGSFTDRQGALRPLTYQNQGTFFTVEIEGQVDQVIFYLRKNHTSIYEVIMENSRRKNRRNDYARL